MARELPNQALLDIREQLATHRLAKEAAERERAAAESRRRHDESMFRAAVGDVTPIAAPNRANAAKPAASAIGRRRADAPLVATPGPALSDGALNAEEDDAADFVREGTGADIARKLRAGNWPVQGELDLHGMTRDDARQALAGFLDTALATGLRCLRVIHGKGFSSARGAAVLKPLARHWLAQTPAVLAFAQPRESEGGAGAVLVLLRPPAGPLKAKRRN
jgi:DNA-nicking Smr family endonuclease